MNNLLKKIIGFVLVVAVSITFVGCGKSTVYKTYSDFFGSDVTLVVTGGKGKEVESVWQKITDRLDKIKLSLSADETQDRESKNTDAQNAFRYVEIFNSLKTGESVEVDFETFSVVEECKKLNSLSGGLFNPCVKNLSDLWGFTSRFYSGSYEKTKKYDRDYNSVGGFEDPEQNYIEAFTCLADFSSLKTKNSDGRYYLEKTCPSVVIDGEEYFQQIDLSAISKGYAADAIKPFLTSLDGDYYVSFGGSSLYIGGSGGKERELKVTDPLSRIRAPLGSVNVKDTFVSTAGVYERRYYTESGKMRHHIIDAANGEPAETDILSVTLIGDDCLFSDGLSTALVSMGSTACLNYLKNLSQYRYIVVTNDKKIFTDTDLRLYEGSEYTIVSTVSAS